jgi:hypothetical protein
MFHRLDSRPFTKRGAGVNLSGNPGKFRERTLIYFCATRCSYRSASVEVLRSPNPKAGQVKSAIPRLVWRDKNADAIYTLAYARALAAQRIGGKSPL